MEALEGRRDEAKLGNNDMTEEENSVERWIEEIRKDLERGDKDEHKLEALRSEAMLGHVLRRIQGKHARGFWRQRLRRAIAAVSSIGAIVWNSRTARILMP